MALSMLPIQDEITTKVKELAQTVYDNGVPEDSSLEYTTDGVMLPFIVLRFAGFVQSGAERGITGPRQDLGRSYIEAVCVGPNERTVRQVADLVVDKLTGFQPTDGGLLTPESTGKPYVVYDSNSRPVKYVSEVGFTFAVNTVIS